MFAFVKRKSGMGLKYNDLYIPNNTQGAKAWFADSCYQNHLPLNLPSPSTMKIGIRSTKTGASWWTCYEGFGLHFYGPFDPATGIGSIDDGQQSIDNGQPFNLAGQRVGKDYKGIVIQNGRKILRK